MSFFLLYSPRPSSSLFPYTTLFRSTVTIFALLAFGLVLGGMGGQAVVGPVELVLPIETPLWLSTAGILAAAIRSEEHTSELQSRGQLVCRLLLEKKNITSHTQSYIK